MFSNRRTTRRAAARVVVIGAAAGCLAGLYGVAATEAIVPVSSVSALPNSAPIPVPATPGPCTATSWDANGRPTHVRCNGPVVPPTTNVPLGGNSPLYDGYGRPMVPTPPPSNSGVVVGGVMPPPGGVRNDSTHVTLPYIPAQVPHATPRRNPLDYPITPAERQAAAQRAQILNDQANGTWAQAAGIGYSNGTYTVNGRTFTNRGDAMFERNHPRPR